MTVNIVPLWCKKINMAVTNAKIVVIVISCIKEEGEIATLFLARDLHKAELAVRNIGPGAATSEWGGD